MRFLVTDRQRFTAIKMKRLDRLGAFRFPVIGGGVKPGHDVAGGGIEIKKLPRFFGRRINQERRLLIVQREMIAFEAATFRAAQEIIEPAKHPVGIRVFRPKMFNVRAMRIAAIHTALAVARHHLKHVKCSLDRYGLPSGFPSGLDIQVARRPFFIGSPLFPIERFDRLWQQSESLNFLHGSSFGFGRGKELKLVSTLVFRFGQLATGAFLGL